MAATIPSNPTQSIPILFQLPNTPDDFTVMMPPASLRRINFSALDFTAARRAIVEYIKTYFPTIFNDFATASGVVMFMEMVAAESAKLALRADMNVNETYVGTCTTEVALTNILALINQSILRQTSATIDIQISIVNATTTDLQIPAGTKLTTTGPDNLPVYYEVYAAPGDFSSPIIIPAGKRGIIAYGIEGQFASPVSFTSAGGAFQTFNIVDPTMLTSPILVTVQTGNAIANWQVVTQPIQLYGPTDEVVEVSFVGKTCTLLFGDNNTGKALLPGQVVTVNYRSGGGVRGQVSTGQLIQTSQLTPLAPANAPVQVTFTNPVPSVGGTDKETLQQAKQRAPRDAAILSAIVTPDDYAQFASSFTHPVFGTVAKAVAVLRSDLNANLVELYCLALGANGAMVTPSAGLKLGLMTYVDDMNVATDQVAVLDGAVKAVSITMNVVVSTNADATVVKTNVEAAVTAFFAATNWQMGQPLYVSNLIEVVEAVDGVAYVDIFSPADNILPTSQLAVPGSPGVGINELIVQGERIINYYYES